MVELLCAASWLLLPPSMQPHSEVWEDASAAAYDVGLCKEGSLLAPLGGSPSSGPGVQADSAELQQLLPEYRALLADFAQLRANVDAMARCIRKQGIAVPLRCRCGGDGGASANGASLESAMALPRVASRVFAAAGQVGWSAALRLSRSSRSSARSVQEQKVFVVGSMQGMQEQGGHLERKASVEVFDLRSGTWQPAPPLPSHRFGHAMGVIGGYLYVCGDNRESCRSTLCYSPMTQRWVALANMKRPRGFASAVVLNRELYMVGGATSVFLWESIERLRPNGASQTATWSVIPGTMLTARRSFAAVALSGKIFMCGGCEQLLSFKSTPDASSVTAEVFSPTTGISHRVASMSTPRIYHTATVIGSKVIAAGGSIPGTGRALRSVELYFPSGDHWCLCPDLAMPFPRGGHTATAIVGRLFVMGGKSQDVKGSPGLASVLGLDLATGAWEVFQPMTEGRVAFASGLIACGPTSVI